MVPSKAFQVTALFEVVPETVAVNGNVPLVIDEAVAGVTVTEVTPEPDACEPAATVTVAVADFVESATLVAVIFPVPPVAGAVNMPADEIVPIVADQVTASFVVVPCTAAVNCTEALGAGDATNGDTAIEETNGLVDEPLPCRGSVTGRWLGSVMNATLPVTAPVLVAANFTLKLALCPAGKLRGMVNPVMLKPDPVKTA
jgi:hypothetical protein